MQFLKQLFLVLSLMACLLSLSKIDILALDVVINTNSNQKTANSKSNLRFVKINIGDYFGSGSMIPEGFLSQKGITSGSGLLTTTHIFQNSLAHDIIKEKGINLSGQNTLECEYSIGKSDEFAIFLPTNVVNELISKKLIFVETISSFETTIDNTKYNQNPDVQTKIFGSSSKNLDLKDNLVQKGDSGSMIYQQINGDIKMVGVQFGYAKNTSAPLTILWKIKSGQYFPTADVAWFQNNDNKYIWENQNYLPKNCQKTSNKNRFKVSPPTYLNKV
jgi:hypothetical protein